MIPTIVLVHSPLVGPSTWHPTADALERRTSNAVIVPRLPGLATLPLPRSLRVAAAVAEMLTLHESLVLVGHSGAGPLLPLIADRTSVPVVAYLFVDAGLPPASGAVKLVPTGLRAQLEAIAVAGVLPRWNDWLGPEVVEALLPDEDLRHKIEREMSHVPVSYFDEAPSVPPGWSHSPCAYLQLSSAYADTAADAASRGWLVERIDGSHLSTVTDPELVADRIGSIVERLGIRTH